MTRPELTADRLSNWQITVLALALIGGSHTRQDTDEVAIKSWQIAPRRFSWERHPEFPNLDTARVALSDAKKRKNGALVTGDNYAGWLLTPAGVGWVKDNEGLADDVSRAPRSSALTVGESTALQTVRSHPIFSAWKSGDADIDVYQLAEALQLPADAPRKIIIDRATHVENAALAAEDEEIQEFVKWARASITKAR